MSLVTALENLAMDAQEIALQWTNVPKMQLVNAYVVILIFIVIFVSWQKVLQLIDYLRNHLLSRCISSQLFRDYSRRLLLQLPCANRVIVLFYWMLPLSRFSQSFVKSTLADPSELSSANKVDQSEQSESAEKPIEANEANEANAYYSTWLKVNNLVRGYILYAVMEFVYYFTSVDNFYFGVMSLGQVIYEGRGLVSWRGIFSLLIFSLERVWSALRDMTPGFIQQILDNNRPAQRYTNIEQINSINSKSQLKRKINLKDGKTNLVGFAPVPVKQLTLGRCDLILLNAGDIVPADVILLSGQDEIIAKEIQLTGERNQKPKCVLGYQFERQNISTTNNIGSSIVGMDAKNFWLKCRSGNWKKVVCRIDKYELLLLDENFANENLRLKLLNQLGKRGDDSNRAFASTQITSGQNIVALVERVGENCKIRAKTVDARDPTPLTRTLDTIYAINLFILMFFAVTMAVILDSTNDSIEVAETETGVDGWQPRFLERIISCTLFLQTIIPLSLQLYRNVNAHVLAGRISKLLDISISSKGKTAIQSNITIIVTDKTGTLTTNKARFLGIRRHCVLDNDIAYGYGMEVISPLIQLDSISPSSFPVEDTNEAMKNFDARLLRGIMACNSTRVVKFTPVGKTEENKTATATLSAEEKKVEVASSQSSSSLMSSISMLLEVDALEYQLLLATKMKLVCNIFRGNHSTGEIVWNSSISPVELGSQTKFNSQLERVYYKEFDHDTGVKCAIVRVACVTGDGSGTTNSIAYELHVQGTPEAIGKYAMDKKMMDHLIASEHHRIKSQVKDTAVNSNASCDRTIAYGSRALDEKEVSEFLADLDKTRTIASTTETASSSLQGVVDPVVAVNQLQQRFLKDLDQIGLYVFDDLLVPGLVPAVQRILNDPHQTQKHFLICTGDRMDTTKQVADTIDPTSSGSKSSTGSLDESSLHIQTVAEMVQAGKDAITHDGSLYGKRYTRAKDLRKDPKGGVRRVRSPIGSLSGEKKGRIFLAGSVIETLMNAYSNALTGSTTPAITAAAVAITVAADSYIGASRPTSMAKLIARDDARDRVLLNSFHRIHLWNLIRRARMTCVYRAKPIHKQQLITLLKITANQVGGNGDKVVHGVLMAGDGENDKGAMLKSDLSVACEGESESIKLISDVSVQGWHKIPELLDECERKMIIAETACKWSLMQHMLKAYSNLGLFVFSTFQQITENEGFVAMLMFKASLLFLSNCYCQVEDFKSIPLHVIKKKLPTFPVIIIKGALIGLIDAFLVYLWSTTATLAATVSYDLMPVATEPAELAAIDLSSVTNITNASNILMPIYFFQLLLQLVKLKNTPWTPSQNRCISVLSLGWFVYFWFQSSSIGLALSVTAFSFLVFH